MKNLSDEVLANIEEVVPSWLLRNPNLFKLILIRSTELAFGALGKSGVIRGPIHSSVGQEVVAVAACASLEDSDFMLSNHRGHGHYLAKGGNLTNLIYELLGDDRGCCSGLGGSMHVAELDSGILGSNGIVGAGVPIACGVSLAEKIKGSGAVTMVFLGDGAMNQGVVMESLNLAAIYSLPVIFVCENNQYAYSTRSDDMTKNAYHERASGFGIEATHLQDTSLNQNLKIMEKVVSKTRQKSMPHFVEFFTYRLHRHFETERQRAVDYLLADLHEHRSMNDPVTRECVELGQDESECDNVIAEVKFIITSFAETCVKK